MENSNRRLLEELIEELKKTPIHKSDFRNDKPIKIKTNDYKVESISRVPNEKEKIEFIQVRLKTLYLLKEINKAQYKTARRQCINDRESVLRFISRIEGQENICKQFYDYCNTKQNYIEATCKLLLNSNIEYSVVDIDLINKG